MTGCRSSSLWRPWCIWNSAAWSLSVVYIDRTKTMSSTHDARCGHQSLTSTPACPCFLNPTWSGKICEWGRSSPTTARDRSLNRGDFTGLGYGVWSYVLPAYRLSAGFGSQVSRWLTPPERKIQMTLFVLGAKWALPSGGDQAGVSA